MEGGNSAHYYGRGDPTQDDYGEPDRKMEALMLAPADGVETPTKAYPHGK